MADETEKSAENVPLQNRRDAMASMGRYAAFVAPAMAVLIKGDPAGARHLTNPGGGGNVSPS